MQLVIKKNSVGLRLDKFLVKNLSDFSRSQIQKMIKSGNILVGTRHGVFKKIKKHYFLKLNDIIKINISKTKIKDNKNLLQSIKIISATENYLVLNKPAGLLVHPSDNSQEKTLVDWLIKKYPAIQEVGDKENKEWQTRPGIVHRLDRDVSGLMLVALTQDMFDNLKKQFKQRKINKEYTALVYGKVEPPQGKIERSISRSTKTGLMVAKTDHKLAAFFAKKAITQFEVVQYFKNYTLLKLKLITGRTHQIRVHLKSIGHSIVGDKLYQTKDLKNKKSSIDLDRIFLCSTKLGFYNLENKWQEFEINLPTELTKILDKLR